jgi:glyoxylate reductase
MLTRREKIIKPKLFLASNVFIDEEIGSNSKISEHYRTKIKELWEYLKKICDLRVFNGRFPSLSQLRNDIKNFNPEIVGCHLSHEIPIEILEDSNIFAISTATMGYNHIGRIPGDTILITHTPGVLFETVADFTIALIMGNLRNLVDLHNYVWNGNWTAEEKWDLDQKLCSVINNKKLGILGLGQIGQEIVNRLHPWGIEIIYTDISRNLDMEKRYANLQFTDKLEDIFRFCDIISIHIPLNEKTKGIIDKNLLKIMKKDALLVNTARGPIINFFDLLNLLENKEIAINLAFDVFSPKEPIEPQILTRFKKIKEANPNLRFTFIPHNASADADTRARMNIMFLQDIVKIIESKNFEDLKEVHIIPEQKKNLNQINFRIKKYWEKKI